MLSLQKRLLALKTAAETRKARLNDSAAFLQFNWKADVIESWISKLFTELQGRSRISKGFELKVEAQWV